MKKSRSAFIKKSNKGGGYTATIKFSANRDARLKIRRQSESFNRAYSQWRKDNDGDLGFYPEQSVYSFTNTNIGSVPLSKRSETAVYKRVIAFLGKIILTLAAFILLFETIIPFLIGRFSEKLVFDFYNGMLYGSNGEFTSLLLSIIDVILCFGLIIFTGVLVLKIPANVTFPLSISSKRMFFTGIAAAAALSAINVCYRKLFGVPEFFFDTSAEGFFTPQTIIRIVMYAVIIPILCELAFRGVLLQLLRQFGDVSAVITSAFLSTVTVCAVINSDITGLHGEAFPIYVVMMFPLWFLAAICFGYFTFASGSVITPILMSVVISCGNIAYVLLAELQNDAGVFITSLVCFAAGFFAVLSIMREHSDEVELRLNHTVSISTKIFSVMSPGFLVPVVMLIMSCFLPN
ncbi:MAG: CPBP family intramembrane metalloprotease [Ruminococcus sp.]|nr:CPBP family intramembrane metalloprotease [Ruminococcus sp.]